MLEITIDHYNKCDLETITDPNNSQHFWINKRDLEIESKCKLLLISIKSIKTHRVKIKESN